MVIRRIPIRNLGAGDGVIVQLEEERVSFFRERDEEPLAIVSRPVTDDLRFELNQTWQGAVGKPDYDFTNFGLLFPQNDATEIAYLSRQLPHNMLLATSFQPHLHYVQDEASDPVWKIDYRVIVNGEDPTGGFTTLTSSGTVFTYTSGSLLQIATFPSIPAIGGNPLSAIFEIRLYRDDNVVSGDVLAKSFDLHYQLDSLGSVEAFLKW